MPGIMPLLLFIPREKPQKALRMIVRKDRECLSIRVNRGGSLAAWSCTGDVRASQIIHDPVVIREE